MPPDQAPTAVVPESRTPTLGELFDNHGQTIFRKLRVSMPGRVESYDATKQTVSVKPLLQDIGDNEDGSQTMESLPVVSNVPVVFPSGGGTRITFPIKAGDVVLLVFSDRSLDIWKSKGDEVDPVLFSRHHISDAIAIPGLHDQTANWKTASATDMTLGFDNGPLLKLKQSAIELGNAATQGVGLGDALKTFLDSLVTYIGAHTHTVPIIGPVGLTTTTPPLVAPPSCPTVASSVAKVTP